jgi:hypothetical protein
MTPQFLKKFHNKIYKNITRLEDLATVPCVKVRHLLDEINVKKIDIWILDTEGSELSVLQGTDFEAVKISTIVMECDRSSEERDLDKLNLLRANGYTCEQVMRNCFCKHDSFIPSEVPSGGVRQYTGARFQLKKERAASYRHRKY